MSSNNSPTATHKSEPTARIPSRSERREVARREAKRFNLQQEEIRELGGGQAQPKRTLHHYFEPLPNPRAGYVHVIGADGKPIINPDGNPRVRPAVFGDYRNGVPLQIAQAIRGSCLAKDR